MGTQLRRAKVLAKWKERCGGKKASGVVFPSIKLEKLAPTYRDHCEVVGITRARLFEKKANKLKLRAHDMRAFFVTAAMYAGKDALWITDRSGHDARHAPHLRAGCARVGSAGATANGDTPAGAFMRSSWTRLPPTSAP